MRGDKTQKTKRKKSCENIAVIFNKVYLKWNIVTLWKLRNGSQLNVCRAGKKGCVMPTEQCTVRPPKSAIIEFKSEGNEIRYI